MRYLFLTLLIGVFVTGCAFLPKMPTPQNAKEWRSDIKKVGGAGALHESYIVKQPYWKVVKTIETKSKQCLDTKVVSRSCGGGYYASDCGNKTVDYNPTFKKGKNKSELHLQVDIPDSIYIAKPPKGGLYVSVFDFFKIGENKTKVIVYANNVHFSVIPKAVKHWAKQTNLGCPDLHQ